MRRPPSTDKDLIKRLVRVMVVEGKEPEERTAEEVEFLAQVHAEMTASDAGEDAAVDAAPKQSLRQAKRDRQEQRYAALLGPTGGIAPHVPVKHSPFKQDPAAIDKLLAEDRRQRVTTRTPSRHAEAAKPAVEQDERIRWNPHEAFSISGIGPKAGDS